MSKKPAAFVQFRMVRQKPGEKKKFSPWWTVELEEGETKEVCTRKFTEWIEVGLPEVFPRMGRK
jgi:hypothetical protein